MGQGTFILSMFLLLIDPVRGQRKFRHWFPQMDTMLEYLRENTCQSEYQIYLHDQKQNNQNPLNWASCDSCAIDPIVKCLYDSVWGTGQVNMQTAAVVLGLLPTILTFTGASKVETGILALRRPILATLISIASPAVNPLRAVDYHEPRAILQQWKGSKAHPIPQRSSVREVLAVMFQYATVLGAITNIGEVTYELCDWSVSSFAPTITYLPLFYPATAIALHILGALAVRARVQLVPRADRDDHVREKGVRSWLSLIASQELHLTASEQRDPGNPEAKPLKLSLKDESYRFLIFNWCMSTLAIFHLTFATLIFSSMLFISTQDALVVALRYAISAFVVRFVLSYELFGLREVT